MHCIIAHKQEPSTESLDGPQSRKMMSPTVDTMKTDDNTTFPTCTEKHSKTQEYDGMVKDRKRTDVLYLKAIVCIWIAMTVVGGIAVKHGDPNRLIAPMDDNGSLCGISANVKDAPSFFTITTAGLDSIIFGTLNLLDPKFVTVELTIPTFV